MKRSMYQIASFLGLQMVFTGVKMQRFWDFFSLDLFFGDERGSCSVGLRDGCSKRYHNRFVHVLVLCSCSRLSDNTIDFRIMCIGRRDDNSSNSIGVGVVVYTNKEDSRGSRGETPHDNVWEIETKGQKTKSQKNQTVKKKM